MIKAGAQRLRRRTRADARRARHQPARRLPGDDASWDFGLGAGFYVDATQAPWSAHYRMYSYVTRELPALLAAQFPCRRSSSGRGSRPFDGRPRRAGAARCAIPASTARSRPSRRSRRRAAARGARRRSPATSAPNEDDWLAYDAERAGRPPALPRARSWSTRAPADTFLAEQLQPELFEAACRQSGQALRAAPARRLRPRLLLHPDLHRRPPRVACAGAGGVGT